jgi:rhamnogalacturonyl hydrolase YesR
MIGQSPSNSPNSNYYQAAVRQSNHLRKDVPKYWNGAISHRYSQANLWADFIYMAPPFLAYHGVVTDNVSLLRYAANQCKLYKDILGTSRGPWKHITGPEARDDGLWSSGNGWAVAGMSRVLATMRKSGFNDQTKNEQAMLTSEIKSVIDGVMKLDKDIGHSSGLLRNYLHDMNWFGEISGTALITATVFRMAKLEPGIFGKRYTDWAVKKKGIVDSKIDTNTGIVKPAVNPLKWTDTKPYNKGSPEGQSFVVLMHAAYRDWKR